MPDRFRTEITYFIAPGGPDGTMKLPSNEFWIRLDDTKRWLDDGVVEIVSPLAPDAKAEIELTEEHEAFLEWLAKNEVEHVRLT